ncbi:hypothetical protein DACRYDRAFT_116985 [Dacryopinax primogenitus]|uniref:Uncharacterized protein n=1 Tax=Dacryopinax primogenitus (strain DJM 731) TaxID=1858805 RepID=M5FZB6_DACPD|nr:uncharacterized protein DACRYDRAFT_116985 [Dacryopinax primogenitus]EJU01200.1 hypothetical protein DACRYDRAFT_116985 [Dacryopinax primogenitus]
MPSALEVPGGMWIDDSSSWVDYEPPSAWGIATDPGRDLYDNTYHFSVPSSSLNANATVVFTFPKPGTGFEWYGVKTSQGGILGLCVDCHYYKGITTDYIVVDTLALSELSSNTSVLLYSANGLSNDIHNVSICNLMDPRSGSFGQITVDSFVVQGDGVVQSNTQSLSIPMVSTTVIGLLGIPTSAALPPGLPFSGSAPVASSGSSGGTLSKNQIAGIVVGAVITLALVVLVISLCVRSRTKVPPGVEYAAPLPPSGVSPGPDGKRLCLFHPKRDPKEPTPFILPTMAPASRSPYLHHSAPDRYAHSVNPPSELPSPAQSPVKDEDGIRRWPSLSTSSGEVPPTRNPTNPSVSSFSSIISSIRLPGRMRSTSLKHVPDNKNNIRLQPAVPAQPPNPHNMLFIGNASPAPRSIPDETPIPSLPVIPERAAAVPARIPQRTAPTNPPPSAATHIRPFPAPISTVHQGREDITASPPPTGRGKSFRSTPSRSGKRAIGPRPLSSPNPSIQSRQPSG